MKKILKLVAVAALGALVMTSCGNEGKMKTTESGLTYKFVELNKDAQQVQMGDILVGTCQISINDSVLQSVSTPDRILMVQESAFPGDLPEGLMMLHIGDSAEFYIDADKMVQLGINLPYYTPNTNMKVCYRIRLTDIVTKDEFEQERKNFEENLAQLQAAERDTLAAYAAANNINVQPTNDGLYIVVLKKGKGPLVEIGREVAMNYTGRLLNGKVFDTSIETVAKEAGLYTPNREYTPLRYKVGEMSLISGWEEGVINQPEGSRLRLIIPSALAYGPRALGEIPANSPLVFDIDIVSVK